MINSDDAFLWFMLAKAIDLVFAWLKKRIMAR